ncbi:MAG: hypothetical protein WCM76_12070 [Bacteroidota bacterium]
MSEKDAMIMKLQEKYSKMDLPDDHNREVILKEYKDEYDRNFWDLFHLKDNPHNKYFYIEDFNNKYFCYDFNDGTFFEKRFQKVKKQFQEDYKGLPFLRKVKNFLSQGDDNIIKKLAHYTAYLEARSIIFKSPSIEGKEETLSGRQKVKIEKFRPTLPEMFIDKDKLAEITTKLISNGFVKQNDNMQYLWYGKDLLSTDGSGQIEDGRGLQLVALSMVIEEKALYNALYSASNIHHAFSTYFNSHLKYENFKPSRIAKAEKYTKYFRFI